MAESSSTPRYYDNGSLCATCSQIFLGQRYLREFSMFMVSPAIELMNPYRCRLCLVIWNRHKHITKNIEGEGKTLNLLEIQYHLVKQKGILAGMLAGRLAGMLVTSMRDRFIKQPSKILLLAALISFIK